MKRQGGLVLAFAVLGAATFAATGGSGLSAATKTSSATKSTAISCSGPLKFGFVTPVTGGAGFLGTEQLSWAKLAIKQLAPAMGLKISLSVFDTPVEQGPAPAQTAAQKFVADPKVVEVIGPATSGAVAASSKTYFQAGIAHISSSATRTSLTKGNSKEATPAFFRVVPGDYIQGPSDANFMVNKLKVNKVVLFDFQEPYSLGLADAAQAVLKAKGVDTIRLSAPNTTTDYSSYVTRVPGDADIVFFPTQKPGDANTFARQLAEQGKKAKVFGGDGTNDRSQFNVAGSYLSNFAPDITGIKGDAAIIAAWKKDNPGKQVGTFGPPTYGAVQVALRALKLACNAGHGSIANRRAIVPHVKQVRIPNWILGGTFRWSTKSNDPLNATFYIFQIQSDGSYKLLQ
jgi:branched-chain amino acid transport system substrate-binding protein